MPFDVAEADRLLTTTRTVRRHLDLDREVADDVLLRCIDIAEQAPSGSNQASRRWLIVRDPALKLGLAELYREVGAALLTDMAATPAGGAGTAQRVFGSAAYLARHLERVPALVLLTIHGVHDGSGRPSLFDSVIQSGWSFCLAARARGLGTAWTTLHLGRAEQAAALLGIPPGVTQVALIAVAYATKDDFSPVARRPAAEITYADHWGFLPGGRGVVVERDLPAGPDRVWELVTDIGAPGRYSGENRAAWWTSDAPYGIGSTFRGRNATDDTGHPAINALLLEWLGALEWETPCTVVAWEPGRRVRVRGRAGGRRLGPLGFHAPAPARRPHPGRPLPAAARRAVGDDPRHGRAPRPRRRDPDGPPAGRPVPARRHPRRPRHRDLTPLTAVPGCIRRSVQGVRGPRVPELGTELGHITDGHRGRPRGRFPATPAPRI